MNTNILISDELSNYSVKYKDKLPNETLKFIYSLEQYICYSWANRNFNNIAFEDWSDWNKTNVEASTNIIYNNFIILDANQIQFYNNKHSHALYNYK